MMEKSCNVGVWDVCLDGNIGYVLFACSVQGWELNACLCRSGGQCKDAS